MKCPEFGVLKRRGRWEWVLFRAQPASAFSYGKVKELPPREHSSWATFVILSTKWMLSSS